MFGCLNYIEDNAINSFHFPVLPGASCLICFLKHIYLLDNFFYIQTNSREKNWPNNDLSCKDKYSCVTFLYANIYNLGLGKCSQEKRADTFSSSCFKKKVDLEFKSCMIKINYWPSFSRLFHDRRQQTKISWINQSDRQRENQFGWINVWGSSWLISHYLSLYLPKRRSCRC